MCIQRSWFPAKCIAKRHFQTSFEIIGKITVIILQLLILSVICLCKYVCLELLLSKQILLAAPLFHAGCYSKGSRKKKVIHQILERDPFHFQPSKGQIQSDVATSQSNEIGTSAGMFSPLGFRVLPQQVEEMEHLQRIICLIPKSESLRFQLMKLNEVNSILSLLTIVACYQGVLIYNLRMIQGVCGRN